MDASLITKLDAFVVMFPLPMDLSEANTLRDETVRYIIQRAHTIKSLNLNGCAHLTDVSLSLLLDHCPLLKTVNIGGTKVSYELVGQLKSKGLEVTVETHPVGKFTYTDHSSIERVWHPRDMEFVPSSGALVVDLFSAWRGAGAGLVELGFRVVGVELDADMNLGGEGRVKYLESHVMDVLDIDRDWCEDLKKRLGPVKAVWASPPCTSFSVLGCGRHWTSVRSLPYPPEPKSDIARLGAHVVRHTLRVIEWLNPEFFWIENPRGVLRHMPYLDHLDTREVTYCSYGDSRLKPTDLWGRFPQGWKYRERCTAKTKYGISTDGDGIEWVNNYKGEPCHIKATQSSGRRTGTCLLSYQDKALVPIELSRDVGRSLL